MSPQYDYSKASLKRTPSNLDSEAHRIGSVPSTYHNDAFRVIRLLPGSYADDIKCNLLVWSLRNRQNKFEKPGDYDALSYNWGPQHGDKAITIIVAEDQIYKLNIGPNLDTALRHLRSEGAVTYLWVDAICINQQDMEEKRVQLPLMNHIYNGASCVRVWLGAEEDESAKAMELIHECLDGDQFDRLIKDPSASTRWAALLKLLRRPWFSRRWIIQEIALAKEAEVHCGTKNLCWDDFASVVTRLRSRQPELRALFRESPSHQHHPDFIGDVSNLGAITLADWRDTLLHKRSDRSINGKLCDLETLVSSMTAFEASKPHDIIYAILSLAKDAHAYAGGRATEINTSPHLNSRSRASSLIGSDLDLDDTQRDEQSCIPSPGFDKIVFGSSITKRGRSQSDASERSTDPPREAAEVRSYPQVHLNGEHLHLSEDGSAIAGRDSRSPEPPSNNELGTGVNPAPDRGSMSPAPQVRAHKRMKLSISDVSGEHNKTVVAVSMLKKALKSGRITIDYDRSVLDLYKDFVTLVLTNSRSLDILCTPWAPPNIELPNVELPTWIPQLSGTAFGATKSGVRRRIHADPLVRRAGALETLTKPYNASKGHIASTWSMGGDDGKSLFVRGFMLDEVAELERPATEGAIPVSWMRAGGWTDHSASPPDRFWRTLVGNLTANGLPAHVYWKNACKNAFDMRTSGGHLNTSSTSSIFFECSSDVREFLERVQAVVWNRRLVTMKKLGSSSNDSSALPRLAAEHKRNGEGIALAPDKTKRGDLICILHGCSVPVILRKYINGVPSAKRCPAEDCPTRQYFGSTAERKVTYELIGECYVHGMMNGEAIETVREYSRNRKIEEQMFELR
ncbi:hypothetical protein CKM354_000215100 [Cercospora kikuchii]|uniref:Heterokaryon incompatibility domain-containing protein n=1 Tax=Cercospora kikuchii TaxID=84275 RepID=A0A9P3FCI1_9PEZI|nr:uncharacterized protein CKM354_000215100 [Cercospora kikuchii]GIZ38747.1 hypothetical protein CKM354_000215100 [Cercospora kikuchii]